MPAKAPKPQALKPLPKGKQTTDPNQAGTHTLLVIILLSACLCLPRTKPNLHPLWYFSVVIPCSPPSGTAPELPDEWITVVQGMLGSTSVTALPPLFFPIPASF